MKSTLFWICVLALFLMSPIYSHADQLQNQSNTPHNIIMQRQGNVSGQIVTVHPHSSITLPNDKNIQFYDQQTRNQIPHQPHIVIDKNGIYK
jgi:hypothetical protein